MESAVIETTAVNAANFSAAPFVVPENDAGSVPLSETDGLIFELGLWLSGLESFLNIHNQSFTDESRKKSSQRDWTKEFRLTHSTLLLCSRMTLQLGKIIKERKTSPAESSENAFADERMSAINSIGEEDVFRLSSALKDAVLLNEGLLRGAPLRFGEWTAWSNSLRDKFESVESF